MPSVAIYSPDAAHRRHLEHILRADPSYAIAGSAGDPAALERLLGRPGAEIVVADAPPYDVLSQWCRQFADTAFVVLTPEAGADEFDALAAGAHAVLARTAGASEILATLAAARHGLAVLPRPLLATMLAGGIEAPAPAADPLEHAPPLTAREIEVLRALADGVSNKAIARRLGISYHTVKFHVAAILAKLEAETRTEAVARAAHLGLIML
jgi:DNA-binding NarL/FixJ family response regulator